jgi:LPPG:FO 2-phospho-L-lactate transferase
LITILAGGTGSIKLVRGLYKQFKNISVVSNVADNFWYYGLYICPDIDTMIYGLSDNLDKKRGWGIKDDTFHFLNHMRDVGIEFWFNLGDKDLTTHVLRTHMLKTGCSLTQATHKIAEMYDVPIPIVPASDNHFETNMITESRKRIHLQEYWIQHKASLPLINIVYRNIRAVRPTLQCIKLLKESELIVFAPGNPVSSIGPIISIPGIKKLLRDLKKKVLMVSPFISNKAISGPSAIYMKAKKLDPSLRGLVEYYSKFAGTMIFDNQDQNEVENNVKPRFPDVNFEYTDILMSDNKRETTLAKYITSNFR